MSKVVTILEIHAGGSDPMTFNMSGPKAAAAGKSVGIPGVGVTHLRYPVRKA